MSVYSVIMQLWNGKPEKVTVVEPIPQSLKRCPFCNSAEPHFELWPYGTHRDAIQDKPLYSGTVICRNQITCGASVTCILNDAAVAERDARDRWNRRAA